VRAVTSLAGDAELSEVVAALAAGRGLAHLLDGGDEQADQDGDDGKDHQQFDQRETASASGGEQRHGGLPGKDEGAKEAFKALSPTSQGSGLFLGLLGRVVVAGP
jgi:hypothetical protein